MIQLRLTVHCDYCGNMIDWSSTLVKTNGFAKAITESRKQLKQPAQAWPVHKHICHVCIVTRAAK